MKRRPSPYSRHELSIIVLVALATALVAALALAWYFSRDNRWYRVVSPPNEAVTQIVALDRGLNAYVRTRQGNLYLCGGTTWRDACRQASTDEVPVNKVPLQWLTCGTPFPAVPPAPGVVIDAIEVGRCSGAATYSKLIVLENGSLWQWRRTFSWVNGFAWASGVVAAAMLGMVGGMGVVKLRRYLSDT